MSDLSAKRSWKYVEPEVDSSYRENNLGKTLYDIVLEKKPKIIIEFGILNGYSTISMAQALKKLGEGKIIGYDLWEKYSYKHTTKEKTLENLKRYGVDDIVELKELDFYDWKPENFDLMHIDISNDGSTLDFLEDKHHFLIAESDKTIIFEGGSEERENIEWMKKYNKRKFKDSKVKFKVIEPKFPSISQIC